MQRSFDMTQSRDSFIDWLRDAHAMESQAETMLTSQIGRLESYPDLKMRMEQHLRETEAQRNALGDLLDALGADRSVVKDTMGKLMAAGQGLSGVFVADEVMKGSLASYTFEQMEIASYTMLVAAAEELGEVQAAQVLSRILDEERAMAAWLAENLAPLTRSFLARQDSELQAKR
jgi:ferritin-like metal-binding protein YciE